MGKKKAARTASLNSATAVNPSLKRKHMSREAALEEVSRLELMGFTRREIAARAGVSEVQVCKDLQEVRKRLRERMLESREAAVKRKVAQLEVVRAQAWDAWEASKADRRRVQSEYARPPAPKDKSAGRAADGSGRSAASGTVKFRQSLARIKAVVTREGRLPDSEYMKIIVKTLEMEAELLGLYPEDGGGPGSGGAGGVAVDWSALFLPGGVAALPAHDPVEAEVSRVEAEAAGADPGSPGPAG